MFPTKTPGRPAVVVLALSCAGIAAADGNAPLASRDVHIGADSGWLAAPDAAAGPVQVGSLTLRADNSSWIRLNLAGSVLPGDPASNDSFIVIRSSLDGAEQYLDAQSLAQWSETSAYLNGDEATIDIYLRPGAGEVRIIVDSAVAGPIAPIVSRSICGPTDDRVLSTDPASARLLPTGCTAWIFDDANRTFLSAGHCATGAGSVVQFNVPLSTETGGLQHPPPQDQYPVDYTSVQREYDSRFIGLDWLYFGAFANSNTGLTPYQAQNSFYPTALPTTPAGQTIRITGYGVTGSAVPRQWNQVQKTHTGVFASMSGTIVRYTADTTGGNSGGAVFNESSGRAIGIHTNAGCTANDGANQGTGLHNAALRAALLAPRGVCGSGVAPPAGDIFIVGDINNSFGTINPASGRFGSIRPVGPFIQGLAFDAAQQRFLAIDQSNTLYTLNPPDWTEATLGQVTGSPDPLNGLAMTDDGRLFAIAQATGQLYAVDPSTLAAARIGPAWGGSIGCLEAVPGSTGLYAIDDAPTGSRLVLIDTDDGSVTVVGELGAGASDCNGLAYSPQDGSLYTVDAQTRLALRINPTTGNAAVIGPTGGVFGAGFGMAARIPRPGCPADVDRSGGVDGADIAAFFDAWQRGLTAADVNEDGGIDGDDIGEFMDLWTGGC